MLQFSYVEEEEEEEGKPVIKDKGQRKVFIEEEGDEIVDILDKSVAKKVLGMFDILISECFWLYEHHICIYAIIHPSSLFHCSSAL